MLKQPMIGFSIFKVCYFFFLVKTSIVFILGWLFEENRIRGALGSSLLSISVDNLNHDRVTYFTASGKKYRALCVDGLSKEMCTRTDNQGLIQTQFQVFNDDIERFRVPGGKGGKVEYSVSTPDQRLKSTGEIFLCDDNGISFISD